MKYYRIQTRKQKVVKRYNLKFAIFGIKDIAKISQIASFTIPMKIVINISSVVNALIPGSTEDTGLSVNTWPKVGLKGIRSVSFFTNNLKAKVEKLAKTEVKKGA